MSFLLKNVRVALFSLVLIYNLNKVVVVVNGAIPPRWSWETVPTWFQGCNATGETFNATILPYITRYPLVVFEKCMGDYMPNGTYESHSLAAAKQLKAIDPTINIGFYINSQLDFTEYAMHATMMANPQWWLRNASGAVILINGGANTLDYYSHLNFDFSQYDEAVWWSSACTNATDTGYFDMCNIDRVYTWSASYVGNNTLSNVTVATFDPYKYDMMVNMQAHLNKTNRGVIAINNGFTIPGVNGYNLEGFQPIEEDILMLCNRSNSVSILVIKVHTGYHLSEGCNGQSFIDALASYLIGAQKYQYFQCNQGWIMPTNAAWQTAYERPLGAPVSQPIKVNQTWFRTFESGTTVLFNTSNNTGTILWADEHEQSYLQDLQQLYYQTYRPWHKNWKQGEL